MKIVSAKKNLLENRRLGMALTAGGGGVAAVTTTIEGECGCGCGCGCECECEIRRALCTMSQATSFGNGPAVSVHVFVSSMSKQANCVDDGSLYHPEVPGAVPNTATSVPWRTASRSTTSALANFMRARPFFAWRVGSVKGEG